MLQGASIYWIPAFAGMTKSTVFRFFTKPARFPATRFSMGLEGEIREMKPRVVGSKEAPVMLWRGLFFFYLRAKRNESGSFFPRQHP